MFAADGVVVTVLVDVVVVVAVVVVEVPGSTFAVVVDVMV